ncbi:EamA family transporter [Flavobacterium agricola]|uniref:EamA family transporter n=1 Tax=Flavobacterium agricola TaxID=2870839 RepID=UPI0022216F0A|nr:EamA family transporter [Flavobacterium agricola]
MNVVFRKKQIKKNIQTFKALPKAQKKSTLGLTILGGALLTFNWFIFIYVINHVSIQAGSFGYLICPIVTTVLAFFILKERLNKWQQASIFISIIACLILGFNSLKDVYFSLLIALTYASYLISQRKNKVFDSFISLNIQLLVMVVILAPFYPAYSQAVPTEGIFYICLFFLVVLFTVIPLYLNLYSLTGISSSAVGILIYINPLINFMLAFFYFKEQVSSTQLIGYFIIFCSVILFNKQVLFPDKKLKAMQ